MAMQIVASLIAIVSTISPLFVVFTSDVSDPLILDSTNGSRLWLESFFYQLWIESI